MDFEQLKIYALNKLQTELEASLYYHCYEHTIDVYDAVCMLAKAEIINDNDLVLLKTAALMHDIGFTEKYAHHETVGCEIARRVLPEFNYSPTDIDDICGMIMATKIPQNPKNHLEQIICDADLDYLGRADFYPIGSNLCKELIAFQRIKTTEEWNQLQVKFLQNHQYFTETAKQLRDEQKQRYLNEIKSLVLTYSSLSVEKTISVKPEPSNPQFSEPESGVSQPEPSNPQFSEPESGVSQPEPSNPQFSESESDVSQPEPSNPQFSESESGVSQPEPSNSQFSEPESDVSKLE